LWLIDPFFLACTLPAAADAAGAFAAHLKAFRNAANVWKRSHTDLIPNLKITARS
jgi:hypothetical protein